MSLMHNEAVIANGASQTGPLDMHDRVITTIIVPSVWTAANITLLASSTQTGTFSPVYDAAGTELTISAAASRVVVIAPDATRGLKWVKLRSGTTGTPVNQGAARTLEVGSVCDESA